MLELKLKAEAKDQVLGFAKGGGPLGKRSQEDLLELAIAARQSGNKRLIDLFQDLPPIGQLLNAKAEAAIDQVVETLGPTTGAGAPAEAPKAATPEAGTTTAKK